MNRFGRAYVTLYTDEGRDEAGFKQESQAGVRVLADLERVYEKTLKAYLERGLDNVVRIRFIDPRIGEIVKFRFDQDGEEYIVQENYEDSRKLVLVGGRSR